MTDNPRADHPTSRLVAAAKTWYCGSGCNVFTTTDTNPECGACGQVISTKPTKYALFKDCLQVSKSHSSKDGAIAEAYEAGIVLHHHADFVGDKQFRTLANGYEIREVPNV